MILHKHEGSNFYRPQRKFAKVMFLQVSVCPLGGVAGKVCMAGGVSGREPCVARGHAWWGHAWQGGMNGRGMCGRGTCVVGGVHAMHTPGRYYEIWSMSGRYTSYWNACILVCHIFNGFIIPFLNRGSSLLRSMVP